MESRHINEAFTANLRQAYSNYKTGGSPPLVLDAIDPTKQSYVTAIPPRDFFPYTTVNADTIRENITLPDIRAESSYNVPPRRAGAYRLSRSEEVTRPTQYDDPYGYELEDAAGVPSTGFFRKQYSIPVNRQGRVGASWRHIRQCTGYGGSNLMFIEGSIKDDDIKNYPPYGIVKSKVLVNHLGQRLLPKQNGTSYNQKARKGFKYWYKEPKKNIMEPPAHPVRTISGQQYKIKGL